MLNGFTQLFIFIVLALSFGCNSSGGGGGGGSDKDKAQNEGEKPADAGLTEGQTSEDADPQGTPAVKLPSAEGMNEDPSDFGEDEIGGDDDEVVVIDDEDEEGTDDGGWENDDEEWLGSDDPDLLNEVDLEVGGSKKDEKEKNEKDESQATSKPDAQTAKQIQEILRLTNLERRKNNPECPILKINAKLESAALRHSRDMIAREYFAHEKEGDPNTRPEARLRAVGYRYRTFGENIAYGYPTPEQTIELWMNSAGHRRNILNCSFKEIGIGPVAKKEGKSSSARTTWYWTQIFGTQQ